jgi:hypothetical protein
LPGTTSSTGSGDDAHAAAKPTPSATKPRAMVARMRESLRVKTCGVNIARWSRATRSM